MVPQSGAQLNSKSIGSVSSCIAISQIALQFILYVFGFLRHIKMKRYFYHAIILKSITPNTTSSYQYLIMLISRTYSPNPITGGKASKSENTQISWRYFDVINLFRVTSYHDRSNWTADMYRMAESVAIVYKEPIPLSYENNYFVIKKP